ncbi:MAG: protein kinase domain-containing protein [Pirellula sp.]
MDLDLLLAVLIIQYQFADKARVMEAHEEWLRSKSGKFHEFLVLKGVLSESDKQIILPMFEKLVEKNRGDAELCYSVLSSFDNTKPANRASDAQQDVTGEWIPSSSDLLSESTAKSSESKSPNSGKPRYRVLRPHAKGGLGEVSVATDVELNREVALKEIQNRFVRDADSRARFLLEAEVTGKLEHPGIVPVYGRGAYSDGRPFYAMRFIQGDSLKEAITKFHSQYSQFKNTTERRLVERQLLRRFVDVCFAVDFAHSRGVLHRDIKPGNIMLGQYGETLVVDWGLAKIIGSSTSYDGTSQISISSGSNSAPTQVGSAVGTPAYMPPEQAAGQVDRLGPHSDTYSLGATLYHILTGRPPFEGTNALEIIKLVIKGEFRPPRTINSEIPKSLESICVKAMALEPNDRYPSVRELAQDIERYLADEPVSSMKEPWTAQVFRWIRKHPTATAAAVTGIVLTSLGLIVFSTILGSKNQQLLAANNKLDNKNRELNSSLERESQARQEAVASEEVAKQQSLLALSTLQGVVADIQSAVKDMPGSNRVRRRLLNTSLEQLQRVAADYVSRSAIDESTWAALLELGELVLEFGPEPLATANSNVAGIKEKSSALTLARSLSYRSLVIARELEGKEQDKGRAKLRIAETLSQLAIVLERSGEMQEAIRSLKEVVELQESSDMMTTPKRRRNYLLNMNELGRLQHLMGDAKSAFAVTEKAHKKAIEWEAESSSEETLDGLALCLERLGVLWLHNLDLEKAREVSEQALLVRERIVKEKPDDEFRMHQMANLRDALGDVYAKLSRHQDALAQFEKAYELREKLYTEDAESEIYARGMLATMDRMGDAFFDLASPELALYWYDLGRNQRQKMLDSDPENARMERELALSYEKMGMSKRSLGRHEEALEVLTKCLQMRTKLLDENVESALAQRDVMVTHLQIFNTYAEKEEYLKCREHLQAAQTISKTMLEKGMNIKRSQAEYDQITSQMGVLQEMIEK